MAITRRFILQAGGALSALTVFNALSSTPFSSGEKNLYWTFPKAAWTAICTFIMINTLLRPVPAYGPPMPLLPTTTSYKSGWDFAAWSLSHLRPTAQITGF